MTEGLDDFVITTPLSADVFGLPSPFRVKRVERPELHAVVHTVWLDSTISVAITEETFMQDVDGDYVVPVVRRAALELAHIVCDQTYLYIKECER